MGSTPIEVEIKIKLRNRSDTVNRLEELGAIHSNFIKNIDTYYNTTDITKDFGKTDQALRLRTTLIYSPDGLNLLSEHHDLTYKGPKFATTVKSRIEHICHINEPKEMDEIVQAIGMKKVITISKTRDLYHYKLNNENLEILVDKVEKLPGDYLEAEVLTQTTKDISQKKEIILSFIQKIGYSEQDSIRDSYLELILARLNKT
jgi:adenylate cyclase class 2